MNLWTFESSKCDNIITVDPGYAIYFKRAVLIFGQARNVDAEGARTFKSKILDPDRMLCATMK